MHYIYRTLTSTNPQICDREISQYFIAEMKNLVEILSESDEIQLYLRIFSILREYVTFAFWQYSKPGNKGPPVERLYLCYQAFLLASNNIYPVFTELEKLLKAKCNMTWMDYNKFLFFNHFYEAIDSEIMTKVNCKEKLDVPEEYNAMVLDFGELNTLWQTLKNLKYGINGNMDKEMNEDHKQILKKNFWICRRKIEKKQSVQRLAAELIILASERRVRGCEPLLDKNGQCLCEDCLIFKLSCIVEAGEAPNPSPVRISPCRYCPEVVELNKLHDHVVDHLKSVVDNNAKNINLKGGNNICTLKTQAENENEEQTRQNKMSQCLMNLLKKETNSLKNSHIKTDQQNIRSDKKKTECNDINETEEHYRNPPSKNDGMNKNSSPCSYSCKHEEELRTELKKLQGVCDHHKDSKQCDCTYCEVFGSTIASHAHKTSETRNRLRVRLNQRKQKMVSKNPLVDKANKMTTKSLVTMKRNTPKVEPIVQTENPSPMKTTAIVRTIPKSADSIIEDMNIASEMKTKMTLGNEESTKLNDIPGLVDFIEGNSGSDKAAIAEKKAAKKARQRKKKEEERKQIEEKERQKEEEERREAEAKLRLVKQIERGKIITNEGNKKTQKKQRCKEKGSLNTSISDKTDRSEFIEETIPATVTIKRSVENGDKRPTVTITLKGSTPDQDELFCTLVNSHTESNNKEDKDGQTKSKKNKKCTKAKDQKSEHFVKLHVLRKNTEKTKNGKSNNLSGKEVKVSFTVSNSNNVNANADFGTNNTKQIEVENKKNNDLDLPFLKLPPGITITKINGPVSNRNHKITVNGVDSSGGNISVNNKSGVIVVDTEKLIQTNRGSKDSSSSRKNKKKKNKKKQLSGPNPSVDNTQAPMITLKNPIFQTLPDTVARGSSIPMEIAGASCGQASIFKNENGMVTIRSSRLQQSLNNGVPLHNLLSDLKPVMSGDVSNIMPKSCSSSESTMGSLNAQEILSGLPGIEITKVHKKNSYSDHDSQTCQVAQVSIIPTNGDKCNLDKDDWIYDNIFTPKDVLEDDLDAEERELEAFKRFCQQSIPPKQKEKVVHLNVKDIVLKKKNDINLA
ncbi:hypothetical protein HHI36_023142 [Cryptolaemus montrouzieri]|uniref:FAM193 C-terminal domain-containing protein n=1 Tax=Cryptolaemus montrouzieri TaxID=559131 RepID=A0ABD2PH38_9CUCU